MHKWQAVVLVFLVALGVRLATLNKMGKTWDEPAYVETGYHFVQLFQKGDFNNPFWYIQSDHPPLIRYVYGIAGAFEIQNIDKNGNIHFHYNYTIPRLVSVLLGSLSAIFIVLIGFKYFSPFIGFSSGLIFSLIPFFIGLSQLATLESFIMFFFTATVYFYIEYIKTLRKRHLILCGIMMGLSFLVKQSDILVVPLLFLIFITWNIFNKPKKISKLAKNFFKQFVTLGILSFITVFVLWPMPFFHLKEVWNVQNTMWVKAVKLPPPEVFFGRLMLVPLPYYYTMFLITTPLLLIILSFIGALKIDKKRTFVSISILIWFLFPFMQSFYAFKQHGVRYIIELYAPFALLCGIGLDFLLDYFRKIKHIKIISLLFVCLYLFIVLYKISPYYLDYFNEVVGGNNNVYNKRLFQMGWWGQGINEAAQYISKNEKRKVTVAVDGAQPAGVMPQLSNIQVVYYHEYKNPDYVIVPYFNVVRLWFPEWELNKNYKVVYSVMVDKAQLDKVYKRIN